MSVCVRPEAAIGVADPIGCCERDYESIDKRHFDAHARDMKKVWVPLTILLLSACGDNQLAGSDAVPIDAKQVSSEGTTPATPTTVSSTAAVTGMEPADPRLVGPRQAFKVLLPDGFKQRGNGLTQGGGESFPGHTLDTATYIDIATHQMVTISLERGVDRDRGGETDRSGDGEPRWNSIRGQRDALDRPNIEEPGRLVGAVSVFGGLGIRRRNE